MAGGLVATIAAEETARLGFAFHATDVYRAAMRAIHLPNLALAQLIGVKFNVAVAVMTTARHKTRLC